MVLRCRSAEQAVYQPSSRVVCDVDAVTPFFDVFDVHVGVGFERRAKRARKRRASAVGVDDARRMQLLHVTLSRNDAR